MKKRLFIVLFTVLILTFATVVVVQAADYSEFTIAVEAGAVDENGYVNVDIMMYNNPGIAGANFKIAFDNTQIQIVDFAKVYDSDNDVYYPSTVLSGGCAISIADKGVEYEKVNTITYACYNAYNMTNNGSLLNLTFKLLEGVNSAEIYVVPNGVFPTQDFVRLTPNLVSDIVERMPVNVDFMTFDGYQVRKDDYNGLRSIFIVDYTTMPTLEKDGFEVVELGAIFASTDRLLASGDDFVVTKDADGTYKTVSYGVSVPVIKNGELFGKYIRKTETELEFACTLTNFTKNDYNLNVSIRGYVVLADADGNEYIGYCDYPNEEYRSVSLEVICDILFERDMITADAISYAHVLKFREEKQSSYMG